MSHAAVTHPKVARAIDNDDDLFADVPDISLDEIEVTPEHRAHLQWFADSLRGWVGSDRLDHDDETVKP